MLVIVLILAVLLAPGIYFCWKGREHDTFKIEETKDGIILWYNWRGNWIPDSDYKTKEEAIERIKFYRNKSLRRPMLPRWPI